MITNNSLIVASSSFNLCFGPFDFVFALVTSVSGSAATPAPSPPATALSELELSFEFASVGVEVALLISLMASDVTEVGVVTELDTFFSLLVSLSGVFVFESLFVFSLV